MIIRNFKKGAVYCALFYASQLTAQTTGPESMMGAEIKAGKLSVMANDLGGNVTIIPKSVIQQIPVQTTAELLGYIEGVDLRQRGPNGVQADVQIQGGTFDQVLVLIDGVRMSDPQTGHHQLNLMVPPEVIERIEIFKGAAARRYGVNALSGVINIVTSKSMNSGIQLTSYMGSGFEKDTTTENTYNNKGLRMVAGLNSKEVTGWVSAGYDQGNGYRHNTDFRAFRSSVKLNSVPLNDKDARFSLFGGVIHNAFGANGFYAAPADKNSFETVTTQIGSLGVSKPLKTGVIEAKINARYNTDHYVFVRNNPSLYQNFHNTTVFMPEVTYNLAREYWSLALGMESRKEWIESSNLGSHDRLFIGNYLDIAMKPISRVKLSFGVYRLFNEVIGQKFYPGADILVHLWNHESLNGPKLNFFASTGQGQRLPTFTDLYYTGPSNLGNALLQPESSRSVEMGLRKTGNRLQMQAAVFKRNQFQMIDRIRDSVTAPWVPINYIGDNFMIQGFEFRISGFKEMRYDAFFYRLGFKSVRWSLGGSQLQQLDNLSNFKGQSQYSVNFMPRQYLGSLNLQTKYNVQVVTQYRFMQRNATGFDANSKYSMLDVRVTYNFRRKIKDTGSKHLPDEIVQPTKQPNSVSIWVNAQNMLNTQYKEIATVPLMPRWITFGLTIVPTKAVSGEVLITKK